MPKSQTSPNFQEKEAIAICGHYVIYTITFGQSFLAGVIMSAHQDFMMVFLNMSQDELIIMKLMGKYIKVLSQGIAAFFADLVTGYTYHYVICSCVLKCTSIIFLFFPFIPHDFAGRYNYFALWFYHVNDGFSEASTIAFCGDQFLLPEQRKKLSDFFLIYFWMKSFGECLGLLLGMLTLRRECLLTDFCLSLTNFMPLILSILVTSLLILFWKMFNRVCRYKYRIIPTIYSVLVCALKERVRNHRNGKKFLEYASNIYSKSILEDIARFKVMIFLFVLPVARGIAHEIRFDTSFIFVKSDTYHTGLPQNKDNINLFKSSVHAIFAPIFYFLIYPVLTRRRCLVSLSSRIVVGLLLYMLSMFISIYMYQYLIVKPAVPEGMQQLTLYNNLNVSIKLESKLLTTTIAPYNLETITIKNEEPDDYPYAIKYNDKTIKGTFKAEDSVFVGYYFSQANTLSRFTTNKSSVHPGRPRFTPLVYIKTAKEVEFVLVELVVVVKEHVWPTPRQFEVDQAKYVMKINNMVIGNVELLQRGVYTLLCKEELSGLFTFKATLENKKPFTISVLLFLPQIIVFEIGNIMFIVSLNELIYTQSPVMLKAVIIWLFDGVYFLVVYGEYANQISNGYVKIGIYIACLAICCILFAIISKLYRFIPVTNVLPHDIEPVKIQQ